MKRIALVCVLVVSLMVPLVPVSAATCAPPRCLDVKVPVPRGLKVPDSTVRVLLPRGYGDSRTRYPVLYLLHGVGDTYRTWSENTDVAKLTERYPLIVVMPDGGKGQDAGWYSDWKDGSRQWETFHTKVLASYVDHAFRTLGTGHRAIAGASMGGFGAMSYAARHRGLYRAAASFSGFVDTMFGAPVSGAFYPYGGRGLAGNSLGTPQQGVWGDQTADEKRWREHNPKDRARELKGVTLVVACGNGTPGGPAGDDPSRPYSYPAESYLWQMNESFVRALGDAGVKYTAEFYSGYHNWPYWQYELRRVLPKLAAAIR
jgi:S-formylglutathione hydrolase FrmB